MLKTESIVFYHATNEYNNPGFRLISVKVVQRTSAFGEFMNNLVPVFDRGWNGVCEKDQTAWTFNHLPYAQAFIDAVTDPEFLGQHGFIGTTQGGKDPMFGESSVLVSSSEGKPVAVVSLTTGMKEYTAAKIARSREGIAATQNFAEDRAIPSTGNYDDGTKTPTRERPNYRVTFTSAQRKS